MRSTLSAIATTSVILLASQASRALEFPEPYRDGQAVCGPQSFAAKVHGFWIDVPIDYENPGRGTEKIFTWTNEKFDPAKESVIHFDGGPGMPSAGEHHFDSKVPDFNVVYFNQRGSLCSLPRDKRLLLDPTYLSSKNIAKDGNEIRKRFGIPKWTVYGASYGTIPATIAGHLFPESTVAVVLEGIIYDGSERLWSAPFRLWSQNRFFRGLPASLRSRVLQVTNLSGASPEWFSQWMKGRAHLLEGSGYEQSVKALEEMLSRPDEALSEILARWTPATASSLATDPTEGAFQFLVISCAELSGNSEIASWEAVFDSNGTLAPSKRGSLKSECEKHGLTSSATFKAKDYPISVPVTYFQGERDPATPLNHAVAHFRKVATGDRQLLLAPSRGHDVSGNFCMPPQKALFQEALRGQEITQEMIDRAKNPGATPLVIFR